MLGELENAFIFALLDSLKCLSGGIGRRAGFKIQFWQQSGGSIPPSGTKALFFLNKALFFTSTFTCLENERNRGKLFCPKRGSRVKLLYRPEVAVCHYIVCIARLTSFACK